MNEKLLKQLKVITNEEREILSGRKEINRSIYMQQDTTRIDSTLLLEKGKLITLRPHTRFVHFPKHTHNYVEMVYMCSGKTRHRINENEVTLEKGEILLLSQNATQEIFPAGENDIAVNFIILPQFFDVAINLIGEEKNDLRDFLINTLRNDKSSGGYLHFKVADILPIQNLIENLIWTLTNHQINKRSINQITMGLLFLQLVNHTEALSTHPGVENQNLMLNIMRYIEENYVCGSLEEAAELLCCNIYFLSRYIKKEMGKTFTQLMQQKRLNQAGFLLRTTSKKVIDICQSVGYENASYFHRIFREYYGMSPRKYRANKDAF